MKGKMHRLEAEKKVCLIFTDEEWEKGGPIEVNGLFLQTTNPTPVKEPGKIAHAAAATTEAITDTTKATVVATGHVIDRTKGFFSSIGSGIKRNAEEYNAVKEAEREKKALEKMVKEQVEITLKEKKA